MCAEAAEPPPEIKLPKAVLQQLCQKQQWPPPRFERLPPGGHRLAHAGMRYSVTLSMPASSGPRKKKVSQCVIFQSFWFDVLGCKVHHASYHQHVQSMVEILHLLLSELRRDWKT